MRKLNVGWVLFVIIFFIVGWGSTVVLGRGGSAGGSEPPAEPPQQAQPAPTTASTSTVPVMPAITPEPTETSVGWEVYWQNPSDEVPTVVHETCPQSDATQSEYRIQPGQRFLARVSTCQPYQGRNVVEVKIQTETGQTIRGYAVAFDSFEPAGSE